MITTKPLFRQTHFIIVFYFFLQLLLDFVQKLNTTYNLSLTPYHRFLKLGFFLFMIIFIAYNIKKIPKLLLVTYTCFHLIFIMSFNITLDRIEFFIQYDFFFSLVLLFSLVKLNTNSAAILYKGFKIFIFINFACILSAIIFDIGVFKTYYFRFGYNGLIITQMQSTVVYLSALTIALMKRDLLFTIITIASCLLVGTKALLVGVPIFLIFLFIFNKSFFSVKKIAISSILFVLTFVLLITNPFFSKIAKEDGVLAVFFSYRNLKFEETYYLIRPKYDLLNFLVGGYDFPQFRTELDFVDIFLFLGILGLCVLGVNLNHIKKKYKTGHLMESYFYVIILVAIFGGNIILYPVNMVMFFLTISLVHFNFNNQ